MTSQIKQKSSNMNNTQPCNLPANAPADYRAKLRSGITRLKQHAQALYEKTYPEGRDWIQQAVAEAEASAWKTPFPSLFFMPLAQARITEAQSQIATSPTRTFRA
jgi:hypothetical protein